MAMNVDISKITGINQVGNSYQRKSAVPLDYYSFFNTKAAAETYAASNPVAYIGQYVAYTHEGKVFACVIADEAGTLKEIGSKPIGDNASIEVAEDGKVSLYGFNELTNDKVRYLPVTKLVGEGAEAHLEIEWVSQLADETKLAQAASVTAVGDDTSYAIEAVRADKDGNLAVVLPKQPVISLIRAEMGSAGHLKREIVDTLPSVDDADPDTIYMIKAGGASAVMRIIQDGYGYIIDGQFAPSADKRFYEVQVTPGATYKVSTGVSVTTADYYIKNEAGRYILAGELDTSDEVVPGVEFDYDYQDSLTIPADAAAVNGISTCAIVLNEILNINSITPVQVGGDQYKEYMLVDGVFEQIGDTTVNLEGYATEDYVDNKLEAYAKIGDAYTKEEMAPILYEGAYIKSENGEDVETPSIINAADRKNSRLISPEEIRKLSVLEIGENGIEISGTVNAANVKGLAKAIEDQVTAETGLGIEEGAEVNIIETVKVNGEALKPDANRAVNIVIPTSHVNDVVVRAKKTNGEGAVTYESKLKATRSDETNVITLDDSALQDAINAVNNNVVHSISVNKAPVNADSEHHVNITAETGTQNGTIAIAGQDVAVKGLGTAAFENKDAFKLVQKVVADPTADEFKGTTLSYLATITQNEQGVITATKQTYDLKTNVLDPIAANKTAIEKIYKAEGETTTGLLPSLQQEVAANKTAIEHIYKNENGVESGLLPALKTTVGDHTIALATLIGTVEGDNTKSVRQIAEAVAKAEVGSAGHLKREIVEALPNIADADPDTIYMIKTGGPNAVMRIIQDGYCDVIDGQLAPNADKRFYEVQVTPGATYKVSTGVTDATATYYIKNEVGTYIVAGVLDTSDEAVSGDGYTYYQDSLTIPADAAAVNGIATCVIVVNDKININDIIPVQAGGDQYKEYMLIDGVFEQIGDTTVNLTGYATEDFVRQLVTNSAPSRADTNTLGLVKSTAAGENAAPNKVTVEGDGTMTVTKISTDILVNSSTEELILFGGTASTAVKA